MVMFVLYEVKKNVSFLENKKQNSDFLHYKARVIVLIYKKIKNSVDGMHETVYSN